ncbi:TPA: hypothetical protein DCY43_03420 [candidate division WWE3 bacterium]|uniref:Uncharacterized protein n=1 Tax=candidate division WWE3 bacterium TaxID=2053526 RepID=A0A351JTZ3_UNCKA|nr:hypothetical protein [candidate division WWE3 bacterium]
MVGVAVAGATAVEVAGTTLVAVATGALVGKVVGVVVAGWDFIPGRLSQAVADKATNRTTSKTNFFISAS